MRFDDMTLAAALLIANMNTVTEGSVFTCFWCGQSTLGAHKAGCPFVSARDVVRAATPEEITIAQSVIDKLNKQPIAHFGTKEENKC